MQSVYPDGSDHRAFTDPQHASWPSQSYPAHNGEVEARAITSLTSRQSDYIPDGQAHYHAFDYEHAPIYLPSHHDRYHVCSLSPQVFFSF